MRKLDHDIKFLNTCQNNDLYPTFIQYEISSTRLQNSNAYWQSQRLFIHKELTFKNVEQEKITLEMKRIKSDLRIVINLIDWTHIVERFWRVTSKQSKGLKVLKITNFQSLWVKNYNMTLKKLHIISHFINYLILKSSYYVKIWIFHYHRNALNSKIIYCHLDCYTEMFMVVITKMSLFCILKVKYRMLRYYHIEFITKR